MWVKLFGIIRRERDKKQQTGGSRQADTIIHRFIRRVDKKDQQHMKFQLDLHLNEGWTSKLFVCISVYKQQIPTQICNSLCY